MSKFISGHDGRNLRRANRETSGTLAWVHISGVCLLLMLCSGCPQREEQTSKLQAKSTLTDSQRAVTEEQAEAFAVQLKSYFTDPDSDTKLPIDKALFAANVGEGLPDTRKIKKDLAVMSDASTSTMAKSIRDLISQGGDYSLQKIDEDNGRRRVRMRLLLPDAGVNYHSFLLVHLPTGVVADDIDVAATGELLSRTLNRMALQIVADAEPDQPGKHRATRSELAAHLKEIQQMSALHNKQPERVLEIYESLPTNLQQEKIVMLYRVFAAASVSDEEYLKALGEMRARFPDDPAVLLQSFDFFLLSGKYDQSLSAIDALDKTVGGDPYLNVLRGAVAVAQGDRQAGVMLAKKAGEAFPEILTVQWQVLRTMISAEDHAATLEQLIFMNARFEMNWDDLNMLDNYEKFIESQQYQEWQKLLQEKM